MANKIPFKPINPIPSKPTTEYQQPLNLVNKKITKPKQKKQPTIIKVSPQSFLKNKQDVATYTNKSSIKPKQKTSATPIAEPATTNKQKAHPANKSKTTIKPLQTKSTMPVEITAQPTKSTLKNKPDVVASKVTSQVNKLQTTSAKKEKELTKQTKSKPQTNLNKKLSMTKPKTISKTLPKAVTTKKTKEKTPQKKEVQPNSNKANKQAAIQNQQRVNNRLINKTIANKLIEDTTSPLIKSKIILITNYILLAEKYEIDFNDLLFHKLNRLHDHLYHLFGDENIKYFVQTLKENLQQISDILNKPSAEIFQIIHELLTDLDMDSKQLSNQQQHQLTWPKFREAAKANKESCRVFLTKYFHNFFQTQD